jgi:hypothetical protein
MFVRVLKSSSLTCSFKSRTYQGVMIPIGNYSRGVSIPSTYVSTRILLFAPHGYRYMYSYNTHWQSVPLAPHKTAPKPTYTPISNQAFFSFTKTALLNQIQAIRHTILPRDETHHSFFKSNHFLSSSCLAPSFKDLVIDK